MWLCCFCFFLLSFWSSGSLHYRRCWRRSWRTPVVGFVAGISTVPAENSAVISWFLSTVFRGYPTILHTNYEMNSVFDEPSSSLFVILVHLGIVGSRSIPRGIPVYSRQLFYLPLKDTRFSDKKTEKTQASCLYFSNSSASQLLLRVGMCLLIPAPPLKIVT